MASCAKSLKLASVAGKSRPIFDIPFHRSYASFTDVPVVRSAPKSTVSPFDTQILATTYRWPSIQPVSYLSYSNHHLNLPLRRDILHRAVIYEADGDRQGTGSTKHRSDMRGSSRRLRPQKGTGRARLSDRKSPMLRGGGVAHGPHFRDFSTELPSKVYDLAFRTALSYRYKKGELIILQNAITLSEDQGPRLLHNIFTAHNWGQGNRRTMVVAQKRYHFATPAHEATEEARLQRLEESMEQVGEHAEFRTSDEVDVKDLLACGRVLIEAGALKQLLEATTKEFSHLMPYTTIGVPVTSKTPS